MAYQITNQFLSQLDAFSSTVLNSLTPKALDTFIASLLRGYFTKYIVNNPHMQITDISKIDQIVDSIFKKITDQEFINTIMNDLSIADVTALDEFDAEEFISDEHFSRYLTPT